MSDSKVEKKARSGGLNKWYREMKSELKKVVWPTWEQVAKNTGVVITMVIIVGAFIALADFGLKSGVSALITLR